MERFTEREKEILFEMSLGLSDIEIGDKLCLGLSTVKTHTNNIYTKLFLQDHPKHTKRVNAVLFYINAIRKGKNDKLA